MLIEVFKTESVNLNNTKYTHEGMMDIMKSWSHESSRPVYIETKSKDRKELGFINRANVFYDENTKILSINVPDEIVSQFRGSVVVPNVSIEKEYRSKDNTIMIIDSYQIQGFQISQETPAFQGLRSQIL